MPRAASRAPRPRPPQARAPGLSPCSASSPRPRPALRPAPPADPAPFPPLPPSPFQLGASANISTVFAASDVAIDKWLKSHNMTMEDLKKREALADRIIAYSVILGEPGLVDDIKPGQKVQVPTLANGW